MKQKELAACSDEELLKLAKEMERTPVYDAVIIGLLAGVAIYSAANNGIGILSFLPLVYFPIAGRNRAKKKEVEALLEERGLG